MVKDSINICPLVNDPGPECFCLEMTSRNIESVIRYCSGDYETCAIYQKRMQDEDRD